MEDTLGKVYSWNRQRVLRFSSVVLIVKVFIQIIVFIEFLMLTR